MDLADDAWTEEEVKEIIQFLKHRGRSRFFLPNQNNFHSSFLCTGMKAFLTEYVIVRQIPIPRLLYAFGISLVGLFALNFLPRLKEPGSAKSCGRNGPRPKRTSSRSSSSKCMYHVDPRSGFDDLCIPISLQRRQKLSNYNSIDDAVELIHKSRNILILTGAGISK